jgi:hypothetical protein
MSGRNEDCRGLMGNMIKIVISISCSVIASTFLRSVEAQDLLPVAGKSFGSIVPAVGELDGDVGNGQEVVVVSKEGDVSAVRVDGTRLWTAVLPNTTCAAVKSYDRSYSSAVIGELFGDGIPYVVVGFGGFTGKSCDGGVVAYRGDTGAQAWVFSLKDWSKKKKFFSFRAAVYGTPVLADVDNDGELEVGFGAFDRNVYLLNANGSVRWYYNAADTVFDSPVFTDINGDGRKEMIIGTDISRNKIIRPPTPNGGYLYAFDASRSVSPGTLFRFRDRRLQLWRAQFNQVIQTDPVVGDVLPASAGEEVVIGAGCYFPSRSSAKLGKWFKVVSARTGRVLRTLPVSACTASAAAIGDVNGDGLPDVVVTVSGNKSFGGDGNSYVIAWTPSTDTILWKVTPTLGGRRDSYGGHNRRQPVLADLTGDGRPEVIITLSLGVVILDGLSGGQLTCGVESPCTKPLLRIDSFVGGSPAVVDTDGDGRLEVMVAGKQNDSRNVVRWEDPLSF